MPMTFNGDEFAKVLSEGTLQEPIALDGMVKPVEGDTSAIDFSQGTSCAHWTRIPVAMIESVEVHTTIACRDHSHPFVTLILKTPHAENAEANVLVSLLHAATIAHTTYDEEDEEAFGPEPWYIHKSTRQAYSCFCSQTRDEGKYYKRLRGSYKNSVLCNKAIRKSKVCTKNPR